MFPVVDNYCFDLFVLKLLLLCRRTMDIDLFASISDNMDIWCGVSDNVDM